MDLCLKEEPCEIMMPDRMPGSRRVWLHDGSPVRDVPGRDVVGGASAPAPLRVAGALKDQASARDLW